MTDGERLRARVRSALTFLCVLCGAAAHAQPPATVAVELREGEARRVSHGATERFEYVVDVAAADTYLLQIDQLGLDLIVSVRAPSGAETTFNSPLFRDGSELALLSAGPGRYRIAVRSDEHTNAGGGHTATLARIPPGTDSRALDAWRLTSDGAAANFAGGEDGWRKAAAAYTSAAELWAVLGRTREEGDAWFAVATLRYWQLFEWDPAAELAARAAAVYHALGEAGLAANAEHLQAAALVEKALEAKQSASGAAISPESAALFAQGLGLLEAARRTHERLGNVYDLGLVLNNFGYTYYGKGELDRARGYYSQAVTLLESIGESTAATTPLENLAVLDAEAGQLVSAIATFERVVARLPQDLEQRRSITLDNLAASQRMLGDLEPALATSAAALELQRKHDDDEGEGRSLRRIGETYYALGQLDLAEEYLQQALPISVASNDGRNQEATLRNLGNVAFVERDPAAALDYHRRALEIAASVSDRAHLQLLIAKDLLALGRGAESLAAAQQAAEVAGGTGSQLLIAGALQAIGRAQTLEGEPAAALASLERSAAIFDSLELGAEHAEALHGLALAARAAGDLDRALEYGAGALRELETLRARVTDPELRAFFAGARRDYYETQIGLLMSRGPRAAGSSDEPAVQALQVSERGRARMVADLLKEAALGTQHGFDPKLRTRESALYQQLAERRYRRDLLIEQGASGAPLDDVVAELASLENELNLVEIELRRANPKYRELTAPDVLTPAQMQARLDPDTVLLQYALGPDASYVWAVTHDAVAAVTLADRATIEAAARRALEDLRERPQAAPADPAALRELAALVIAPIAAHLKRPRVVLALDGALQYVPFGALPIARADGSLETLLSSHEVVEVPSLSVLPAGGHERAAAERQSLAVFADPVLQASDPRLRALQAAVDLERPANGLAARASAGTDLQRLLSTSYEAESIAALVAEDRRLLARGFEASRAAVLGADLGGFRYIHFATHGVVDSRYPGLSALVLSQFDEHGNRQEGFLRLNDIYGLRLTADLVVLSACETALGREMRGEGLIGLTQGFMSAGARSLIASLWQVPDRATAELMTQFYGYVLTDGLRPSEALRKAQLWSAAQPRYRHPYYWAGFVLVGDWR